MDTGVGFINLDDSVKIALNIALAVARENANECYTPSHLLKALLHKDVGLRDFIISIGKDLGYLEEWADVHIEQCPKSTRFAEIKPSEKIDAVFRAADDARIQMGLFDINPICVLLALTKPGIAFSSDQLRSFPIRRSSDLIAVRRAFAFTLFIWFPSRLNAPLGASVTL